VAAAEAKAQARGTVVKPKRTLRTLTLAVMALAAIVAGAMAFSLHREALYATGESEAVDLGDFATADAAANDNQYVRVHVSLEEPAARFRRPLEQSHYRVARAAPDRWVVYAMPDGYTAARFLPPRLVAGRLVRASDLGVRFGGVADITGPDAWVLIDGDVPYGITWVIGLEVMLLGFVLFNLIGIARVVRPVR
jgi:hypothetical protein